MKRALRARFTVRTPKRLQQALICLMNVLDPNNEHHLPDLIVHSEEIPRRFERNLRGFFDRITVRATTDRRKRDRSDFIFQRKLQRIAVAICQSLRFVMFSAAPDRPHSVNHEANRQVIAAGDLRFAWLTTAERAAFGQQFGTGGTVNRPIDTATTEKRRIRRVHNGINLELRYVTAEDSDFVLGIFHESLDHTDEVRMTKL